MKRKLTMTVAMALMLVATSAQVGRAEDGPGTKWVACRNTAYTNYYRCVDAATTSWGGYMCGVGGTADLLACDAALLSYFNQT